ncbi:divalent-cation tolerance protein CutA [Natranaerobius trueperi]|uniref:Divalent-cation tolerance protein CutA n=2 Tax=Natranaerobius trueperi TaxID=759412 RepID=A0A226BWJ5_9FIRM|nr:divalent-cation tolerance protein CutA [Natranaerobius trueperi]
MFYITCDSMEEAEKLAKQLVEERLVACINVVPKIKSFFYWEGKAQSEEELLLLGKTRTDVVDQLVERVKYLHSYDVPCVVSWEITEGNEEFLHWIDSEVK